MTTLEPLPSTQWNQPDEQGSPRRSSKHLATLVHAHTRLLVALILIFALTMGLIIGWATRSQPSARSAGSTASHSSQISFSLATLEANADRSIVDVVSTLDYGTAKAAGTGIVLTSTGEILTNNHVIDGATSIKVTDVGNGKAYSARVVGYDQSADIAVLQLSSASGLTTADLGNSSTVTVGEAVFALGNAGGTGGTPSEVSGKVTALNQSITASDEYEGTSENLSELIESNANLQSGDSGGPLLNSSGQVIGLDTAALANAASPFASNAASQSYSVPINEALGVAQEIEASDTSSTIHIGDSAFLGIELSGSASSQSTTAGVAIEGVVTGSPAAEAGLVAGDEITAVDGETVDSADILSADMTQFKPGETVTVTWTDTSGTAHESTVSLANGPAA